MQLNLTFSCFGHLVKCGGLFIVLATFKKLKQNVAITNNTGERQFDRPYALSGSLRATDSDLVAFRKKSQRTNERRKEK